MTGLWNLQDERESSSARTAGTWIRIIRQTLDLTQEELGERIGYSRVMIRKIEADERRLSRDAAERFARLAEIPPEQHAQFVRVVRSVGAVEGPAPRLLPLSSPATLPPCPYRGLRAYREEDAHNFAGRAELSGRLTELVAQRPTVAVIGPSGSGKSSLVMAGLLPRLRHSGGWETVVLRPGESPLVALAAGLIDHLEPDINEAERLLATTRLAQALRAGELTVRDLVTRVLDQHHDVQSLLLVVDQFEELYTQQIDPQEADTFVRLLLHHPAAGAMADLPWRCVLTLRADFLGRALEHAALGPVVQDASLLVGAMSTADLRLAITEPAGRMGVAFEPGLVDRILQEHGAEGTLPVLEFTLSLLWPQQEHQTITHAAYDRIGGVRHALVGHAEAVLAGLTADQLQDIRRVLLRMVKPGEGVPDTRRVARLSEVGNQSWHLVSRLATARLLVTGYDERERTETAELAHDALVAEWPRLQQWLQQDRAFRLWQDGLQRRLLEWRLAGQQPDLLLAGPALNQAVDWARARPLDLTPEERSFVQRSVERRRRGRQLAILRRAGLGAAGLLLFGAGLVVARGLFGAGPSGDGPEVDKVVEAARAELLRAQDRALLLSLEAVRMVSSPQTLGILADALFYSRQLPDYLQSQPGPLLAAAHSPDGKLLAAGGPDRTLWVWQAGSATPRALHGHKSWIVSLAFSADGRMLATAGADRHVLLWDTATLQPIGDPLQGHTREVLSVALSRDGRYVAAGGTDGTVLVWNAQTHRLVGPPLSGHTDEVSAVAFSPDSRVLASAAFDGTVRLWDAATWASLPAPSYRHPNLVWGLGFSPDGRWLASSSFKGTVLVSDVQTLKTVAEFKVEHDAPAFRLAWGPKGDILAHGAGKEVHLRQMPSGALLHPPLRGHEHVVTAVMFTPDGGTVTSSSVDGTIRTWSTATGDASGPPVTPPKHQSEFTSVAVGPQGRLAAAGTHGGRVLVWRLADRAPAGELGARGSPIAVVDFGQTDNVVIAGNQDGTLAWWIHDGAWAALREVRAHTEAVTGLAVARAAGRLYSAGADGVLRAWDLRTGASLGSAPAGHAPGPVVLAVGQEGTLLVSAGADGRIRRWDAADLKQRGDAIGRGDAGITSIALDRAGRTVAVGTAGGRLELWDAVTGALLQPPGAGKGDAAFAHTRGRVQSLAFSPRGDILYSGGEDQAIRMWSVPHQTPIGAGFWMRDDLEAHAGPVQGLGATPDGRHLVSVGVDNAAMKWNIGFDEWPALACSFARRNLSKTEWQKHFPQRPYQRTCPEFPASD